jgi:hypothetical protein
LPFWIVDHDAPPASMAVILARWLESSGGTINAGELAFGNPPLPAAAVIVVPPGDRGLSGHPF